MIASDSVILRGLFAGAIAFTAVSALIFGIIVLECVFSGVEFYKAIPFIIWRSVKGGAIVGVVAALLFCTKGVRKL